MCVCVSVCAWFHLGLNGIFFFLVQIGYAVHSLALVADSFHMVCELRCGFPISTSFRGYLSDTV